MLKLEFSKENYFAKVLKKPHIIYIDYVSKKEI